MKIATNKKTWLLRSLIIFIILFISLLIYAIFLYMDLNEKRTEGFDVTERQIIKQTPITKVSSIERFHGEKAYHVIFGENAEGEEKLLFFPLEGKERTLTTINSEEIIPKSSIIDEWRSKCASCELIRVVPALINDDALWELTYYDANNRYVLEYLSIYDASAYEEIRYRRMFN